MRVNMVRAQHVAIRVVGPLARNPGCAARPTRIHQRNHVAASVGDGKRHGTGGRTPCTLFIFNYRRSRIDMFYNDLCCLGRRLVK